MSKQSFLIQRQFLIKIGYQFVCEVLTDDENNAGTWFAKYSDKRTTKWARIYDGAINYETKGLNGENFKRY
jgi:hypothetical protein